MTAIKQVAVMAPAHVKNMGRYLNDERALARESQNIAHEDRWAQEMDRTREAYGHNDPSRAGAKNTYMYHQVLGFNPDEIDINGGKLTPSNCMDYAREYIQTRYPNQEAVWVLHKEHCKADGTDRYAVHIGINRTDLETGRRLNEGRAKEAKVSRANTVRDLDRKRGLQEMRANERNSRAHARQPSRTEREMRNRQIKPEKDYIRERVRARVEELKKSPQQNSVRALANSLKKDGIAMTLNKDKSDFTFSRGYKGADGKPKTLNINGYRLGKGFSMGAITHALNAAQSLGSALDRGME